MKALAIAWLVVLAAAVAGVVAWLNVAYWDGFFPHAGRWEELTGAIDVIGLAAVGVAVFLGLLYVTLQAIDEIWP